MKNGKRLLALLLALVMLLTLCACGKSKDDADDEDDVKKEKDTLIGEWTPVDGGGTLTFEKDGTGVWSNMPVEWSTEGDQLTLLSIIEVFGATKEYTFGYCFEDGKLILTTDTGEELVYVRPGITTTKPKIDLNDVDLSYTEIDDNLVGKWYYTDNAEAMMVFRDDGTGYFSSAFDGDTDFVWGVDGDTLVVVNEEGEEENFEYQINYDDYYTEELVLITSNGEEIYLERDE